MRGATFAVLLSCLVSLPSQGREVTGTKHLRGAASGKIRSPATPQTHARALPVVSAAIADLADRSTEELRSYRRALMTRLLLDQGRVAMTGPPALHGALVLAAVCVLLSERPDASSAGGPTEEAAATLARATYILHAAGHAYRTRPGLRAAVAELQRSAKSGASRALFAELAESAEHLEALGRRWFPEALHEAVADGDPAREFDLLRGLWLEREGRLKQASRAVGQAVAHRATVASTIDLVRILAHGESRRAARALADRLRDKAPGASGVLDAVLRHAEDTAGTAVFERGRQAAAVAARLGQVGRYARLDRVQDAQGLLAELVRADLAQPGVFEVAAGLYLRWRRLGRLAQLVADAEGLETPPARLVEARVAAVVAARLAGTQGGTPHDLASRDIGDDLATLGRSADPALRRFGAHAAVIVAATSREDEALEAAASRALQVEQSTATLEVIAAAWLSMGRMDRAITTLERGLVRLAPSRRSSVTLQLASLELAVGAGRTDRGLLRKGLERLTALEVTSPGQVAEQVYLQAIGGRVAAWLGSAAPGVGGPGASDEVALRRLLPLVDQIDPTDPRGAVVVTGATLSAGALGMALGSYDLAIGAFQIARRLTLSPFMERLVVGQVTLAAGDVEGAGLALDGAVSSARTQVERFLAHKWRALAANRAGSMANARTHFEGMLGAWKGAQAPRRKRGRQPVALLLGGVEIAAALPPDGAAHIQAVLTATPALAADFPHDRQRIETVTGRTQKKRKKPRRRGKRSRRR